MPLRSWPASATPVDHSAAPKGFGTDERHAYDLHSAIRNLRFVLDDAHAADFLARPSVERKCARLKVIIARFGDALDSAIRKPDAHFRAHGPTDARIVQNARQISKFEIHSIFIHLLKIVRMHRL
jgi:hypothetical protein